MVSNKDSHNITKALLELAVSQLMAGVHTDLVLRTCIVALFEKSKYWSKQLDSVLRI